MLRHLCAVRRRDARFPARTSSSQLGALLRFSHRQLPRHLPQEFSGHDVNGVYNLKTVRAYLLKEDFQQFWEYQSPTWAAKFLDDWCQQVMRSRIEPMKKVAKTVLGHRELILNYFRAKKQFSSGVIEGLNNKAKLTMRKAYGFRTFPVIELALYHALGKLPEPNVAHRFY